MQESSKQIVGCFKIENFFFKSTGTACYRTTEKRIGDHPTSGTHTHTEHLQGMIKQFSLFMNISTGILPDLGKDIYTLNVVTSDTSYLSWSLSWTFKSNTRTSFISVSGSTTLPQSRNPLLSYLQQIAIHLQLHWSLSGKENYLFYLF